MLSAVDMDAMVHFDKDLHSTNEVCLFLAFRGLLIPTMGPLGQLVSSTTELKQANLIPRDTRWTWTLVITHVSNMHE